MKVLIDNNKVLVFERTYKPGDVNDTQEQQSSYRVNRIISVLHVQGEFMQTFQRAALACVIGIWLAGVSGVASAQQKFPSKPIRIVVGVTPGGTSDILQRLIGSKLSEQWGQPVVIDNRVPDSIDLQRSVP